MMESISDIGKSNKQILAKRIRLLDSLKGVRVGDWIKEKNGNFTRVTYIWRDDKGTPFQVQTGGYDSSSYYLGNKHISYSGGLDSGVDLNKSRLVNLGYKRNGSVWFFDKDIARAGGGVNFVMKFRVFEVK